MLLTFFILLLFFIALVIWKIRIAVLVMIVALPAYLFRIQIWGIPTTFLEAMIISSFAIWFIKNHKTFFYQLRQNIKAKKIRFRYPFDTEMILLLVISFIAMGVAGFNNEAMGIWKAYFLEPIAVYILLINVFNEKRDSIILALSLSAFAVSLYSVIQYFGGVFWIEPGGIRRVTSFFTYPNAVGLYLAPIFLLMTGYMFARNDGGRFRVRNYALSVSCILSFLAIYLARSEGAMIGIIAGLFFFGILINKKTRLITIMLSVVAVAFVFLVPQTRSYAIEKFTLSDLSGEIRKSQWRETIAMIKHDHTWLTGTGLSNYQNAVRSYHVDGIFYNFENDPDFRRKIVIFDDKYRAEHWQPTEIYKYPHNIILNFWTELGLFGALLFIWIFVKLFIGIWHLARPDSARLAFDANRDKRDRLIFIGLFASVVTIIIHGLVDVPYFKNDLSVLFWIIIYLSVANKKRLAIGSGESE